MGSSRNVLDLKSVALVFASRTTVALALGLEATCLALALSLKVSGLCLAPA